MQCLGAHRPDGSDLIGAWTRSPVTDLSLRPAGSPTRQIGPNGGANSVIPTEAETVIGGVDTHKHNQQIETVVHATAPELVKLFGVGTELAGQFLVTAGDNPERIRNEKAFAELCGVAPQPASSGRTTGRHRLCRSGDRQANSALYIVAIVRLRHHEPTRAYVERRTNEGLSKREIIRCRKRYIARGFYANLPRPQNNSPGTNIQSTAA